MIRSAHVGGKEVRREIIPANDVLDYPLRAGSRHSKRLRLPSMVDDFCLEWKGFAE